MSFGAWNFKGAGISELRVAKLQGFGCLLSRVLGLQGVGVLLLLLLRWGVMRSVITVSGFQGLWVSVVWGVSSRGCVFELLHFRHHLKSHVRHHLKSEDTTQGPSRGYSRRVLGTIGAFL